MLLYLLANILKSWLAVRAFLQVRLTSPCGAKTKHTANLTHSEARVWQQEAAPSNNIIQPSQRRRGRRARAADRALTGPKTQAAPHPVEQVCTRAAEPALTGPRLATHRGRRRGRG